MNHFTNFDPYTSGERNGQMRTEVGSLRLQGQLRKNRKVRRSSRAFALVERGRLLVGKARLAQERTRRWHDRAIHFAGAQIENHKP